MVRKHRIKTHDNPWFPVVFTFNQSIQSIRVPTSVLFGIDCQAWSPQPVQWGSQLCHSPRAMGMSHLRRSASKSLLRLGDRCESQGVVSMDWGWLRASFRTWHWSFFICSPNSPTQNCLYPMKLGFSHVIAWTFMDYVCVVCWFDQYTDPTTSFFWLFVSNQSLSQTQGEKSAVKPGHGNYHYINPKNKPSPNRSWCLGILQCGMMQSDPTDSLYMFILIVLFVSCLINHDIPL